MPWGKTGRGAVLCPQWGTGGRPLGLWITVWRERQESVGSHDYPTDIPRIR